MLPVPFNNPATYDGHSGVDYGQPRGTPFPASGAGVVTWLGNNARGGNFIWVKYDALYPEVGYHHMDSHGGCPPVGSRFNTGDRLGYVGNSGHSTGPHLHSEVEGHATTAGYWNYFDPNRLVGSAGSGAGMEEEMLADERNAVLSTHQAIFYGGGAAGDQTIIDRLVELQQVVREVLPRVRNLDQQLTGADGQAINLVQHVLDLGARLNDLDADTDPAILAEAIVDAIPGNIAEGVLDGLAKRLARENDAPA